MSNLFKDQKDISQIIKEINGDIDNYAVEEKRNMTTDASFVAGCNPQIIQRLIYIGVIPRPGQYRRSLKDHLIDVSSLALDYPELSALDLMILQNILCGCGIEDTYERIIECCNEKIRQITEQKYQGSLTPKF